MQRRDRASGAGKLSASDAAETGEGRGHADRADLLADAGRRASFSPEPGRGLLLGIATGTEKLHILGPIIAVARKLAVLLHHLWVSGEVYEPLRNRKQPAMPAAA